MRDLQVWHKLVWIDPDLPRARRARPGARGEGTGIHRRGQGDAARSRAGAAAAGDPEYAAAAARGQVELSTSPFYHPILPLLCDTDVYLRTHPQSRMPREPFRHPEDAAEQLARAVALHERLFGRAPARGVAVGGVGVGRDGAARRRRRASGGWRPTRRSWRGPLGRPFTRDRRRACRSARDALSAVSRRPRRRQPSRADSATTRCRT